MSALTAHWCHTSPTDVTHRPLTDVTPFNNLQTNKRQHDARYLKNATACLNVFMYIKKNDVVYQVWVSKSARFCSSRRNHWFNNVLTGSALKVSADKENNRIALSCRAYKYPALCYAVSPYTSSIQSIREQGSVMVMSMSIGNDILFLCT